MQEQNADALGKKASKAILTFSKLVIDSFLAKLNVVKRSVREDGVCTVIDAKIVPAFKLKQ